MTKKDYTTRDQETKDKFLAIAKEHQDTWSFYRGMVQTKDKTLETAVETMELPAWIVKISEAIFDWLPKEEALIFPLQLLEAIPTNTYTWDLYRERHRTILCDPEHWLNNNVSEERKKLVQECNDIRLGEVIDYDRATYTAKCISRSARVSSPDYSAECAYFSATSAYRSYETIRLSAASSANCAAMSAYFSYKSADLDSPFDHSHHQWMRDVLISLMTK